MSVSVKILVIRFSSVGDIVLASPVVRCLKEQITGADVHFCTEKAFQPLIDYNPYIDKAHYLADSLFKLIRQLRSERYDYVIDLHNNRKTNLIRLALGVPSFSFDKLSWRQFLYVRFKINALPTTNLADRYLEAVRPLGVENDGCGLDYFIPYKDEVEDDWLPDTHRRSFVAYAIGGQYTTRKLPLSRMVELCRKIDHPIVLVGGPEDAWLGERLEGLVGNGLIYNACGKYNLNQTASLLQQARVVFSHDTDLLPVAAAFQKKVYSLWGNTTPYLGMYPYKTSFLILENNNLSCRPCSATGHHRCPLGHFKCMNELSFDFEVKELKRKKANGEL